MSLIFEALQTLESDRAGVDSTASLDAEEFLWCAEHKVASKWETASWEPNDEGRQPPAADEPRLHAVEFPLPVAAETRRALPTPAAIDQNTPPPSPGAALAGSFKESPLAVMPLAQLRIHRNLRVQHLRYRAARFCVLRCRAESFRACAGHLRDHIE